METINIIVVDNFTNTIITIDSFKEVEKAESKFLDKCLSNGISKDDAEIGLEEGFCELPDSSATVNLTWATIE